MNQNEQTKRMEISKKNNWNMYNEVKMIPQPMLLFRSPKKQLRLQKFRNVTFFCFPDACCFFVISLIDFFFCGFPKLCFFLCFPDQAQFGLRIQILKATSNINECELVELYHKYLQMFVNMYKNTIINC